MIVQIGPLCKLMGRHRVVNTDKHTLSSLQGGITMVAKPTKYFPYTYTHSHTFNVILSVKVNQLP